MKLKELLKSHFEINGPTQMGRGITDYILDPKLLKVYEEKLNQCDEFSGSKVEILTEIKSGKPQRIITGYDENGLPIYEIKLSTVSLDNEPIVTVKLDEKTKFAPIVKLYSLSLGSEIFDPNDIFKMKVNTAYLTPTMYDLESLMPIKRLIITFSPEMAQKLAINELHKEIKELEKNEKKPEVKVKIDLNDKNQQDEQIKEQENKMQNLMTNISQADVIAKIQEKENEMLESIIKMVKDCFKEPKKYTLPLKRPILMRVTKDSLLENDKPIRNPLDTMVILKSNDVLI